MGPAVLALIGVIVGALATGWVTVILDRRREQGEVRVAKRLVALELAALAQDFGLVGRGEPPDVSDVWPQPFSTEAFEAEAPRLARVLPAADWNQLSAFYLVVGATRHLLDIGGFDGGVSEQRRTASLENADHANHLRQLLDESPVPIALLPE